MLQRSDTFRYNYHAPLAQGLVFAGLGFRGSDKTTHFQDSSLYGNHGTLTNMAPPTDWVFDPTLCRWVLDFDGANDYVLVTNSTSLALAELTVSFWHKSTEYGPNHSAWYGRYGLLDRDAPGEGNAGWAIVRGQNDGTVDFICRDTVHQSTADISTGAWTHVAVAKDSARAKCYVNGVLDYDNADTGVITNTRNIYIGSLANTTYAATAQIGDLLLYDRALSAAEIQQLADPSNVTYSGLILPPRRKLWPVATSGTYSTTIEMPVFQLTI